MFTGTLNFLDEVRGEGHVPGRLISVNGDPVGPRTDWGGVLHLSRGSFPWCGTRTDVKFQDVTGVRTWSPETVPFYDWATAAMTGSRTKT